MPLISLPAAVAAALPHATATTLEIILAPRCHIRVIDGPELVEADIERLDDAILFWRAMLASETGLVVERLHTLVSLPLGSDVATDVMPGLGRLRHLSLAFGDEE